MNETLPYHEDGFVYFELGSGRLAVFEPGNDPAVYEVPGAKEGVYRLPVDAILSATAREREECPEKLVPVDRAQMFFVDFEAYEVFISTFDDSQGLWPNFEYFDVIRTGIQSAFGYLVAGNEPAEYFEGDGTFIIDVSQLEFVPDPNNRQQAGPRKSELELMERVAKSMGTFVCNECYESEFMCGRYDPQGSAEEAKELGWAVTDEQSSFGSFKVYCPDCAKTSGTA